MLDANELIPWSDADSVALRFANDLYMLEMVGGANLGMYMHEWKKTPLVRLDLAAQCWRFASVIDVIAIAVEVDIVTCPGFTDLEKLDCVTRWGFEPPRAESPGAAGGAGREEADEVRARRARGRPGHGGPRAPPERRRRGCE